MIGAHRAKLRAGVALSAAVVLAGCITLLPKEAPVQLYRFGPAAAAVARTAPQPRFAVQSLALSFDRAAASDRILTITGDEAAYIRGARWVAAAPALFDAAMANAFDAAAGPARLVGRGEVARPDYLLNIDVRAFEARYDHGQGAAPTVVVEVYAALRNASENTLTGERTFTAAIPASDNRAGAIAAAFDQAVGKTLGDLVAWVNAKGVG